MNNSPERIGRETVRSRRRSGRAFALAADPQWLDRGRRASMRTMRACICSRRTLPTICAQWRATMPGLNVTLPHKIAALSAATNSSPEARTVGAANTLVRDGDGWTAHNTDVAGFEAAMRAAVPAMSCANLRVLLIGAGGAARAAVVSLNRAGAHLTIANRSAVERRRARQRACAACRHGGPRADRRRSRRRRHHRQLRQPRACRREPCRRLRRAGGGRSSISPMARRRRRRSTPPRAPAGRRMTGSPCWSRRRPRHFTSGSASRRIRRRRCMPAAQQWRRAHDQAGAHRLHRHGQVRHGRHVRGARRAGL